MDDREKRVWQRVMADQPDPAQTCLKALAMASAQAAETYRALQQSSRGISRELAQRLWEGEQQTLRSLRGLQWMQTGETLKLTPMPHQGQVNRRLRVRLYHTTRRDLTEYMARSAEGEWGCVFQDLARCRQEQCTLLCRLIGIMA